MTDNLRDELDGYLKAWGTAIVSNDADAIARFSIADWMLVTPEAGPIDSDVFFEAVRSGDLTHDTFEVDVHRVVRLGDAAVAVAHVRNTGTYKGMPFTFTVGKHGVLAFEPGLDGRLTETYSDGSMFEIGRITTWEPPSRLAFTWRQASFAPDMGTEVVVAFEAVGTETRVTVEHRGWESVPSEHAAKHGFPSEFFLQRHAEYWRVLLRSLQATATEREGTK